MLCLQVPPFLVAGGSISCPWLRDPGTRETEQPELSEHMWGQHVASSRELAYLVESWEEWLETAGSLLSQELGCLSVALFNAFL